MREDILSQSNQNYVGDLERNKIMKTNYFAYATVVLTLLLVYVFGELKYEKKMGKTKETWLLNDTTQLEDKIVCLETTVTELAKQNKQYEIFIAIIKLKLEEDKNIKTDGLDVNKKEEKPKAKTQSTVPSVPKGYPGKFIPKGQQSPNQESLTI